MLSKEKLAYFEATFNRNTRDDLKHAVSLVVGDRVAIDCGCGAGSDIAYLRTEGFTVYGFDIEQDIIARCKQRFQGDDEVQLSVSSFRSFMYPSAGLVVADASLFFCPKHDFVEVWQKIENSLGKGGIFCGSFLGPEDSMAGSEYDGKAFWPDVLVLTSEQVKNCFNHFEIVSFNEHKVSGTAPGGEPHSWHIFSVVARKR